jgi:hypothetical protein
MKKTKVHILGANGYLGSYLTQELTKDENIELIDLDYGLDYIINCMGYVDVGGCELNPSKSFNSNCGDFIKTCEEFKPKNIINMSSYFVYNKEKEVFNTNYARHKALADNYTVMKKGKNLLLGKLFGKSPNQQHRFPEMCLEEKVYAETTVHPFTRLSTVREAVNRIIYLEKHEEICIDFDSSAYVFANIVGKATVIKTPPMKSFKGYGNFVNCKYEDKGYSGVRKTMIQDYIKEMECTA